MSKYGFGTYGSMLYGETEAAYVGYTANLYCTQTDYKTTNLFWSNVSVPSGDPALTHWKLIKSAGGAPDHPNDGVYIIGDTYPILQTNYVDIENYYPKGTEVVYSFWVFNGSDWIYCGETTSVVVNDVDDSTLKLMRMLPSTWTTSADRFGSATSEPDTFMSNGTTQTDLYRFLNGFAYYYDYLRQRVSNISNISDYRFYPKELLPATLTNKGFTYEPTLGNNYNRSLYRSSEIINSFKGSRLGLNLYVSALTHIDSFLEQSNNLFLDYNQSSFEEGVSTWKATNATIAAKKFANSVADLGYSLVSPGDSTLTSPSVALADSTYKPRNIGYGLVTASNTSNITLTSYDPAKVTTTAIPIFKGNWYQIFGYAQKISSNTGASTITAAISWFDMSGTLISTTSSGTAVTLSTSWQYFESSNAIAQVKAPDNAIYAGVTLTITNTTASNKYILDFLSFGEYPGRFGDMTFGAAYTVYEDARTVKVRLNGARTNYIVNPSFEDAKGGSTISWESYGSTIIPDTAAYVVGTGSCKLTASPGSDSISALISNWVELEPDQHYTFSAYVKGPNTSAQAYAQVEFCSPQSSLDQEAILTDGSTSEKYFNSTNYCVSSTPVTLTNASFTRISVTFKTPYAIEGGSLPLAKASIVMPSATSSNVYYVDACLLEKGTKLLAFFSGSGGINTSNYLNSPTDTIAAFNPITEYYSSSSDCRWEQRVRANFMVNPSFEMSGSSSTTGWTSSTGTTLTSGTATSFGVSSVPYGTYIGKIVNTGSGTYIRSAFVYPAKLSSTIPYGGEMISASAYVYGPAGTYSISFTCNSDTYTKSFTIPGTTWTRISVSNALPVVSSHPVTISVTVAGPTSTTFYVDAVQAELGDIPTSFVDPADSSTVSLHNPSDTGNNIYATLQPATGSGRSYYWPRLVNKSSRLTTNLVNFLPIGSSYALKFGEPSTTYAEVLGSNLYSSSFATQLYGWTPTTTNTTLKRTLASLSKVSGSNNFYSSVGALNSSWVTLKNTTTGDTSFGIYQDSIRIESSQKYKFYAAAKITDSADVGNITMRVDWYDSTNTIISTNYVTKTSAITTINRWNYFECIDSNGDLPSPTNAYYAKVTLTYTPTSRTSTNSVSFDRIMFTQVTY